MGNCKSTMCYCCGNKDHEGCDRNDEENLQQKPITERNGGDILNRAPYELERAASNDEIAVTQTGPTSLSPDNFKITDEYHDLLIKDVKSIKDKKSKAVSCPARTHPPVGLFIQDRNLEFKKIDIEGGLEYEGQIKKGTSERHGYGKLKWPDGSYFEGYWLDGKADGRGIFKTQEGEILEGEWKKDIATGLGVFKHRDGQGMFKGYLREDAQNGRGIELWSDGSYYNGEYKNGQKNGNGIYYWADGSRYAGDWQQDEMHGFGEFIWADGRKYKGTFTEGMMEGEGVYTWKDGRRYQGQYMQNKKNGYGIYIYSDGSRFEGEWLNGQQEGVGFMIDKTGKSKRKGEWKEGDHFRWLD